MTSTTSLERVLNGPTIPKRILKNELLKATSELLLHPQVSKKAIKAWGVMLYHITHTRSA